MDFPLPVRSGSIPVSAIEIAVVENEEAAVGILVLSHREAEICQGVILRPPPLVFCVSKTCRVA